MFLRKPPNKSPCSRALHEASVGQDQHTLLAPREHDVCPPLVRHEPRGGRPNDGKYDVILLVSLERVDIEYRIFPDKTAVLKCILYCMSLGVIWGNDLELSSLSEVSSGHTDDAIDFGWVLGSRIFCIRNGSRLRRSCVPSNCGLPLPPFRRSRPQSDSRWE